MLSALPPALVLTLAVFVGASMDATIKHLTLTNAVIVVVFGRYLFGTFFSAGIWLRADAPRISAEMWRAHGLRGTVIAACAGTFFWALSILPLAEAVTLSFVYPLIAPFAARIMLKERVRASSIVSAVIGFTGVIVAMQGAPSEADAPNHDLGVIAVLVSAFFFSIAIVLLRERSQKDGAEITSLMTSFVPAVIFATPALAFGTLPRMTDWLLFMLMGALAATFMYLMARAYARAEAQQLAPIHYTELVWASVLGYVIFQDVPRLEIYLGAILIIAACLYATYDERRLAAKLKDAT